MSINQPGDDEDTEIVSSLRTVEVGADYRRVYCRNKPTRLPAIPPGSALIAEYNFFGDSNKTYVRIGSQQDLDDLQNPSGRFFQSPQLLKFFFVDVRAID